MVDHPFIDRLKKTSPLSLASLWHLPSFRKDGQTENYATIINMGDGAPETLLDPYECMYLTKNPDGSLTRSVPIPICTPMGEESPNQPVLSKDIMLNSTNKTWLRIFRPANPPPGTQKLPIIIYFHGGGFIIFSAAIAPYHDSCVGMARESPAVVISVEYRLAPENRLPAAYDDAIETIHWVQSQAVDGTGDAWLRDYAEFGRCFLMGSSSGANIVYHVGLQTVALDLKPVKVVGLFFDQPFFGGIERTESELRLIDDRILPLSVTDLMWELALPSGADRDHEYCNLMVSGAHHGAIGSLPRCLVRGYGGDPLSDRRRDFIRMLEGHGVAVVAQFDEDGHHAVEFNDPLKAQALVMAVKDFVCSSTD